MCSNENQRGQVIPLVALCLAALMGFAAFAVDLGYMRYQQRLQQTAADAAAIAAAWQLQTSQNVNPNKCGDPNQPGSPPAVCTAGQAASSSNFFTSPSTCPTPAPAKGTCVSINYPPASGGYQGNTSAVEAIVNVQQPGFFSNIFGRATNPVTTRAVALIRGNPNAPCIYTLTKQLVVNAGAKVNAPCGILVGSDLQASSASVVNVPSIGFVNHSTCSSACGPQTIQAQVQPFADPCPTVPGCVAATATFPDGQTPGSGPYQSCSAISGTPTSLTGGCYSSDLNVGSSGIDLAPGLYIFQGGINLSDGTMTCSTCVTGNSDPSLDTGVTLVIGSVVNTKGTGSMNLPAPPGGQGVGSVSVSTTGIPGIIVYETGAGKGQNGCTNPSNSFAGTLSGMIYAPTCQFNVNSGSVLTLDFLVVDQMEASGIVLTVPNTGKPGSPQTPVLAE